MEVEVRCFTGREVAGRLDEAARLRISVFREFPYLYEGTEEAERLYLADHAGSPRGVLVVAEAAGRVVGVSTGLPLIDADPAFQAPFDRPEDWFYFAESVVESEWRGRGIGHRFMEVREDHAKSLGFTRACFCAVERPSDHPLRPPGYRGNDDFWSKRGYRRQPDLRASYAWRQVDSGESEVENELVFWTRDLGA
jgi:GNAT superfamily N-acetyltransferase